jgi:hypothetical protein
MGFGEMLLDRRSPTDPILLSITMLEDTVVHQHGETMRRIAEIRRMFEQRPGN